MNIHTNPTHPNKAFRAPLFSLSFLETFSLHPLSHPIQQRCNHLLLVTIDTFNKLHNQNLKKINPTSIFFYPFLNAYKRLALFKGLFNSITLKFNIL